MSEAVKELIGQALDQDFAKANQSFNDIITVKMSDLLDQEKIRLADQIYNGVEPDAMDDEEDILGDEDGLDEVDTDIEADDESEQDGEAEQEEPESDDDEEEESAEDDEE